MTFGLILPRMLLEDRSCRARVAAVVHGVPEQVEMPHPMQFGLVRYAAIPTIAEVLFFLEGS